MASKGRNRGGIDSSGAAGPPTPDAGPPPLASMGAVLGVKDIERASRFYQALGFQQQFALPRADGQLTLAVLSYGSSTLLLGRLDELHYEHKARAKRIRRGPHGLGVTLTLLVPDLQTATEPSRQPVSRSCWNRLRSSTGTGSSCFSTPTGMSGRSRRRSSRSALKRWPRSWPGVDAPVREMASWPAVGPRARYAEPSAAPDPARISASGSS